MKKKKLPKPKSKPEELFALHLRVKKITMFVRDYQFAPPRKWKIDFAWPEKAIAIEIEGGIRPFYQWQTDNKTGRKKKVLVKKGRHITEKGFEGDCEKYNALAEKGWSLFRYTPQMVKDGRAIDQVLRVLQ